MSNVKLIIILIVIGLFGVFGFVQSGLFNPAAMVKDGPVLTWLLHTTMDESVERRAQDIDVPDLDSKDMVLAGVSDYADMCSHCHGEPGEPRTAVARGLNPSPPEIDELTEDTTAAEKFWIISNGLRMTGMPAFGKTHDADEIWPVVAFLQSAEDITADDYNRLKEASKGYGHHDHDHNNSAAGNNEEEEHEHNGSHEHASAQNEMAEHDHSATSTENTGEHDHSSHEH